MHPSHCRQQHLPEKMTVTTFLNLGCAAFLSSFPASLHLTWKPYVLFEHNLLLGWFLPFPHLKMPFLSISAHWNSFSSSRQSHLRCYFLHEAFWDSQVSSLIYAPPSIFPSSIHAILPSVIVNLSSYLSPPQVINSLNARILASSLYLVQCLPYDRCLINWI